MSEASAKEQPTPAAGPLTAATTGFGSRPQLEDDRVDEVVEDVAGGGGVVSLARAADVGAGGEAAAGAGEQHGADRGVGAN